jgi:hypothetical protein
MKRIVVVGGGKPPRLVDISTPLPPVKVIPGPLPKIEKPFIKMLEEMDKEIRMKEKREADSDYCPENAEGHEADPRSAIKADGVDWVIDFVCKHCHWGGSILIDPKDIQW